MRKFLSGLVLIPLAVLFVVFAVANRHLVTVSFDPFNTAAPSVGVTLPLFIVLIAIAPGFLLFLLLFLLAVYLGIDLHRRRSRVTSSQMP